METITIGIKSPTVPEAKKITQEDVWGIWSERPMKKVTDGMIVSRSNQTCLVFGDVVPYKSVTVICQSNQFDEVKYWLEYVHGGDCISKTKTLADDKIAIRSDYQCW